MSSSTEVRIKPARYDDHVRMLVLETDEQHPDDHKESGTFGDVLDSLFKKACDQHDPPLGVETVIRFVVEDKGGSVPKLEEMEDILCRALGAKIGPIPGEKWELAHTPINLTSVGARLFNNPEDGKIHLHQMHQDQVLIPPSSETTALLPEQHDRDIHVWGSSDMTDVQGVYIRQRLFTTQGHMGFDEDMVRRQVELRLDAGSIDKKEDQEQLKKTQVTAEWEHDGVVVAGAILRFFHGDDDEIRAND
ncbi:MAG: hypothetical protein Q9183_004166 [Haloplaca sp. 2 TL-2023]